MRRINQHGKSVNAAEGVLRGRDILCFSHDWTGDPLSKTHLMRCLSRDNRVLWVNSIGYRTPTVSKADVSRAFKKLAAAAQPIRESGAEHLRPQPAGHPRLRLGRACARSTACCSAFRSGARCASSVSSAPSTGSSTRPRPSLRASSARSSSFTTAWTSTPRSPACRGGRSPSWRRSCCAWPTWSSSRPSACLSQRARSTRGRCSSGTALISRTSAARSTPKRSFRKKSPLCRGPSSDSSD